jgi:hypothetical protein
MIGLFFGGKKFKTLFGNQFGNIELDANLDEAHEWAAEATTNPVEFGAPITDHVIEKPDMIRIRGFVSDSPTESLISEQGFARLAGLFNGKKVSSKSQAVFDMLHKLIKAKEPITLYTKHRIYTEMIITSVNIPRAANVGEAIEFTVEFVHIRKVKTKTTDVPKGIGQKKESKSPEAQKKTEPQKDAGTKQAEEKKPSSLGSRLLDKVLK